MPVAYVGPPDVYGIFCTVAMTESVNEWLNTVISPIPCISHMGVFFFGARIRLRMTFNYPVLWVRVKGQG